jgi:hypothetical protein
MARPSAGTIRGPDLGARIRGNQVDNQPGETVKDIPWLRLDAIEAGGSGVLAVEPAVHDRQMSRKSATGTRELEQKTGYARLASHS